MTSDGERLHSVRRRRFWLTLAALAVLGLIGGVMGVVIIEQDNGTSFSGTIKGIAGAGVGVLILLFVYGSWRFFQDVDELELLDNLWGSMIGFYAYGALFPAWWALYKLGYVAEPHDWVIFNVALLTALVAYFYRKWRNR